MNHQHCTAVHYIARISSKKKDTRKRKEKMARTQWVVLAVLFFALMGETMAGSICNIDSNKLKFCLPAVSGNSPRPPTRQCCGVVRRANLSCLCRYKDALPSIGINPRYAFALPKKCGVPTPRACHCKFVKL